MSDIFISYASEDRDAARELACAIGATGRSVWWDRQILAGQVFDQVIEHELMSAKCVVVLWSKHSLMSEWVRNEAAVASERGVLIPALIEAVKPPLEFRRKQTADLIGWHGDASHCGFTALCEGISAMTGATPQPTPQREPALPQTRKMPGKRRWVFIAVAVTIVALAFGSYLITQRQSSTPVSVSADHRPDIKSPGGQKQSSGTITEPADLFVGQYYGDVIADAKGPSYSDVTLTITKIDQRNVRVTSDYSRLGSVDVTLNLIRNENTVTSSSDGTILILDLAQNPPKLRYDINSEVVFAGSKR
jgi:hypothetical protein